MKTRLPLGLAFALYLAIIIALPLALSLLVNDPAPIMAAAPIGSTPDVVRTNTYQLDSGHFVRRWIDEEMQLLCLAVTETTPGLQLAGLTCVPLATTAYGLPAVEIK